MQKQIKKYAFLSVICLPVLILLKQIYEFGVNLPFADHWALVPLFMKIDDGTLGFSDLWAQHNEHRIFFPRIIALTLARLTNWYTPAELAFSVLVAIAGMIIIALMLKKTYKKQWQLAVAVLVMALWFFSPIQWQNWLWGWQIEWYMCITSVIATVYLLDRYSVYKKTKLLVLAIIFATIATYSLGSGIFIWAIGLAMLGVYFYQKKIKKNTLIIWSVVWLIETVAYYTNYHKPLDSPSPTLALEYPRGFVEFFITTLGRPVAGQSDAAYLFGLIVIASIACVVFMTYKMRKRLDLNSILIWYALIMYGLIALFITSAGRLGLGIPGAMGSRYTAYSLLIIVGLLGVISVLANTTKNNKNIPKNVLIMICIVCAPLLMQSYSVGRAEMRDQSKLFKDIQLCTSIDYPTDHCLKATFPPSPDAVRVWLDYVKTKHYAGY